MHIYGTQLPKRQELLENLKIPVNITVLIIAQNSEIQYKSSTKNFEDGIIM